MQARARVITVLAILLATIAAGCASPPAGNTPTPPPTDNAGGADIPAERPLRFNQSQAFEYAREQVLYPNGSVRYRTPGTPGNAEVAALLASHFRDLGYHVRYQHFNDTYDCKLTRMHNVIAERDTPAGGKRLYLGAHYDTRPVAEKDEDATNRSKPIAGANDGASGVAVLMELARAIGDRPTATGLTFIFFDGEDGGHVGGRDCTDWILGSRHFARRMTDAQVREAEAMLLVDLVGDPGLRLPREGYSAREPHREVQTRLWTIAARMGVGQFVDEESIAVTDDHVPFQERGVRAVDIIDLRPTTLLQRDPFPPTHHRQTDDLEHLSEASLGAVGRVLERYVLDLGAKAAS